MIDGIFITHAHADHINGLLSKIILPELSIPMYMSSATYEIFQITAFDDLAKHMSKDQLGTFSISEWKNFILRGEGPFARNINTFEHGSPIELSPGELSITPCRAGHIVGATGYVFEFIDLQKTLLYTGDFTLRSLKSVKGATFADLSSVDVLVCEGTNLSKLNNRRMDSFKTFADKIVNTVAQGGTVVIPAFSIGKAQEAVALVSEIQASYMDSNIKLKVAGLAGQVTKVCARYSNALLNLNLSEVGANVIISSAGTMKDDTTIARFVKQVLPDHKSLLVKGSFFDEEYSGWASNFQLNRAKRIRYGGEDFEVNCEIYEFKIPLHAELYEIESLVTSLKPKTVHFVHTVGQGHHNVTPKFDEDQEMHWGKNFQPIELT